MTRKERMAIYVELMLDMRDTADLLITDPENVELLAKHEKLVKQVDWLRSAEDAHAAYDRVLAQMSEQPEATTGAN